MSQQQDPDVEQGLQALNQAEQQQVGLINQGLNEDDIRPDQVARARVIIVKLLAAGIAIDTINKIFPGALGLFLINTIKTAWYMSTSGAVVLAGAAADQVLLTAKSLLSLVTSSISSSVGFVCDSYNILKEYVTKENLNYLLGLIAVRAGSQATQRIEEVATDILNGSNDMDEQIAQKLNSVRRNLRSTGRTAREWVEGYQEAMEHMEQEEPKEGVIDRRLLFEEFDNKLSKDFYEAIAEYLRAVNSQLRPVEFISHLWELDEEDEVDDLPQKLRFLYSLIRGIKKVSGSRNLGGSESLTESQNDRLLQIADPRVRPARAQLGEMSASLPVEVEGRSRENGSSVRGRVCPPTEEEIDKSINDLTDMVSDRTFDPNYAETFELITKNAFLRTIMMEPLNPDAPAEGNIFLAFDKMDDEYQTAVIRSMYNDLPPDVGILNYLSDAKINEWADRFREAIRRNPRRRRVDEPSASDYDIRASAIAPNNYAAPPPDYQPGNDDRVGGRKSHRHRRRRQRITRKGRKGKRRRQTKRRKARRTKRR